VSTSQYQKKTSLGYRISNAMVVLAFSERSGTLFNNVQFPTDIILMVVLLRLRYKLSLRDLVEMFAVRAIYSVMKRYVTGE